MTVIAQARVTLCDPHDCTDAADALTILHAVFDTQGRRVGQDFVPHLASEWRVLEDAQTRAFRLRPDVRFHDGTPCDAAAVAVAASLARMGREEKGYTLGGAGRLAAVSGRRPDRGGRRQARGPLCVRWHRAPIGQWGSAARRSPPSTLRVI